MHSAEHCIQRLCRALLAFPDGSSSWYRGLVKNVKVKFLTVQNNDFHTRQHIEFQEFKELGWLDVERGVN